MRYLVEVGPHRGTGGGLSKLSAAEALIVVRELRKRGIQDVHIVDAKRGEAVTEAELAGGSGLRQAPSPKAPPLQG